MHHMRDGIVSGALVGVSAERGGAPAAALWCLCVDSYRRSVLIRCRVSSVSFVVGGAGYCLR